MEKKMTDEEIAKAILQNIEYSKTITYFDEWGKCKTIKITDILDFTRKNTAKEILLPLIGCEKQIDPLKTGIRWSVLKGFCKRFDVEVE